MTYDTAAATRTSHVREVRGVRLSVDRYNEFRDAFWDDTTVEHLGAKWYVMATTADINRPNTFGATLRSAS